MIETEKKLKRSKDDRIFRKELEDELTAIASEFSEGNRDPLKHYKAKAIELFSLCQR